MREPLAAFEDIETDPRTAIYVAELGGRVVGTFQLTFLRHLTHRGSLVGQIEAVHVAAEKRRVGIGLAMMRFALETSRHIGCCRVQLMSRKGNDKAHRFYEHLGFVASHEGMKLVLVDAR
jgi:GNAT superfamily N-acetyltransferase